jgi:hypothetical protein
MGVAVVMVISASGVSFSDDVYLTARPADAVQLLYTKLRDLG